MTWLSHIGISKYKDNFNLNTFIETGCWQGDGIGHAGSIGFEQIYSCDIGIQYVEDCRHKYPNAHIEHCESMQFLKNLLPTVDRPTLFWLDAHFPEYYGTNESNEDYFIPLIPEIEIIKSFKPNYKNDVIVCDDIRNFRSDKNPRYIPGEVEDKYYIDIDWDMFVNILKDTHDHEYLLKTDGVMVFYPKKVDI